MSGAIPLRSLPLSPDPEWFGWPGARRHERRRHAYASGAEGSPSLCGQARLYENPSMPMLACAACSERWHRQYPMERKP